MNNPNTVPLIPGIYTLSDNQYLIQRLELIKEQLFKPDQNAEQVLQRYLDFNQRSSVLDILHSLGYARADGSAAAEAVTRLQQAHQGMPVILLELAFRPSPEFCTRIYSKLSARIKHPFVIDFKLNTDLLGGAVILVAGKRHDLSVRNWIATQLNA